MGICISCSDAPVSPASLPDTAKVIFPDGALSEFALPMSAGHALASEPSFFICDADEMEFDGHLTALAFGQKLLPGQLYFVLPSQMLNRRLQADELAALAIRASAALIRASTAMGGRCGQGSVAPLVFPDVEKAEVVGKAGKVEMTKTAELKGNRSKNGRGCGGRRRKYRPDLSAIPE